MKKFHGSIQGYERVLPDACYNGGIYRKELGYCMCNVGYTGDRCQTTDDLTKNYYTAPSGSVTTSTPPSTPAPKPAATVSPAVNNPPPKATPASTTSATTSDGVSSDGGDTNSEAESSPTESSPAEVDTPAVTIPAGINDASHYVTIVQSYHNARDKTKQKW
jgi:hypothetical protein